MSLLARMTLLFAAPALLGGCAWDGPTAAVRVVPEATVAGSPVGADDETPAVGGGGAASGTDADARATSGGAVAPAGSPAGRGRVEADAEVAQTPPFPETVAVVGDSLTLSARDEITAELADLGLDVLVVDGVESRRMTAGSSALPSGLDAIGTIREGLDADPDLWVIALGTNDVGAQVDEERFRDDLRATLAGVGSDAPLLWVDLWIRDRRDAVIAANRVIRDEVGDRVPPSGVVGWFVHGDGEGLVAGDGVHLTDRGQEAFASAIADRVSAIYRR